MTASNITTPSLSSKVDPEVKRAIQTLVMHLQKVAAETAAISSGETTGVVATVDEATLNRAVQGAMNEANLFAPDYTIPSAPTGLTATGGFNQIMLEWVASPGDYIGHYEIFRNTTDNQGTAVKIGTTQATIYVDTPPDSSMSTTYFYWVRAINKWDASIIGPFNATAGTPASTADDPAYILEILAGEISESELLASLNERIDLIDTPGTGLVDGLAQEILDRIAAVSAEASARAAALAAEAADRISGDDGLQAQIDALAGDLGAQVYVQPTAPVPGVDGVPDPIPGYSRWYDSDDNNHPYIWMDFGTGLAWQDLEDPRVGQNAAAILALQATVDDPTTGVAANASAIDTLDTTVVNHGNQIAAISSDVSSLDARVTTAEGDINGNASAVSALDARVTTNEGNITSQASDLTSLESRVTTAEGDVSGNASAISGLDTRVTAAEGDITANASDITALETTVNHPTEGVVANAGAIDALDVRVTTAEGSISSQASDITDLEATVNDPTSGVAANASAIDTLDLRVTATEGSISTQAIAIDTVEATISNPTTGLAAAHTAVQTEATARANADNAIAEDVTTLQSVVEDPATGLAAAHSAVQDEATTRANADSAEASAREALAVRVTAAEGGISDNEAAITTEQSARADADSAMAGDISLLEATVEDPDTGLAAAHTAVQTEATARANADGTLEAEHTIKVNANGHIAGMGVAVSGGASGPIESEIIMLADKFAIVKPTASEGEPLTIPFMVGTFDGSPAVIISEALIGDLTVSRAAIKDLAVDDAKIADLSVAKLLAGTIQASGIYLGATGRIHIDGINEKITVNDGTYDRVVIGKLASGWGLEVYNASGDVILNSGGVYASMVNGLGSLALLSQLDNASYIASALIEDGHIKDYIKSTDYNGSIDGSSPGTAGWIINKAAKAVFNNIYARGDVEASSLKANTLMVNEGNINNLQVTTLKIADNAVTIPVSGYNASQQTWRKYTNNEVISATITTYGQPIFLWFSFVQTGAAGTLPEGRIYRDSTIIWDSGSVGDLSIKYLESWQIQITDTPRSGTYTYKLTMNPGGTTTAGAKWRNVLLLGLRK